MPIHLLQFAKKLAHDAGKIALDYQKKGFKVSSKERLNDIVTEADHACNQMIVATIRAHFPDHSILSEESDPMETESDYKWIIDPIDGTVNFAHGLPFFAISIAVAYRGNPIIGVVEIPALHESFWAQSGQGAYLNQKKIHVSQTASLTETLLATGFSYDRDSEGDRRNWALLESLHKPARGIRRLGSVAIDLCYVAAGRFDAYWEFGIKPWDMAAGKVIVEEAGGVVTNIDGTPLSPKRAQILATNGILHSTMLTQLKPLNA